MFYEYLSVASVSLGLPIQFLHCCLVTTRAFMPASLTVIPLTIVEISEFLGQLPVDDDDDDEKSQLDPSSSIASLRSAVHIHTVYQCTLHALPYTIRICKIGRVNYRNTI